MTTNKQTCSDSVTDAIYRAGYNSSGRFYASSTRVLGMTLRQREAKE